MENKKELAKLYGSKDLKHIVTGNNGGSMSVKSWKNLLTLLETKGYSWQAGGNGPKCPPDRSRYLWVTTNKTLSFGDISHIFRDFVIKLNDFKNTI